MVKNDCHIRIQRYKIRTNQLSKAKKHGTTQVFKVSDKQGQFQDRLQEQFLDQFQVKDLTSVLSQLKIIMIFIEIKYLLQNK